MYIIMNIDSLYYSFFLKTICSSSQAVAQVKGTSTHQSSETIIVFCFSSIQGCVLGHGSTLFTTDTSHSQAFENAVSMFPLNHANLEYFCFLSHLFKAEKNKQALFLLTVRSLVTGIVNASLYIASRIQILLSIPLTGPGAV